MNSRATNGVAAADEEFFRAMLWPYGHGEHSTFRAFKPEPRDPHGPWFVVMPGGDALSLNHCSDDAVDEARCRWMVDALNAALASSSGNAGMNAPPLDEMPDTELPGMWERADFTGGQDEVRGSSGNAGVQRDEGMGK